MPKHESSGDSDSSDEVQTSPVGSPVASKQEKEFYGSSSPQAASATNSSHVSSRSGSVSPRSVHSVRSVNSVASAHSGSASSRSRSRSRSSHSRSASPSPSAASVASSRSKSSSPAASPRSKSPSPPTETQQTEQSSRNLYVDLGLDSSGDEDEDQKPVIASPQFARSRSRSRSRSGDEEMPEEPPQITRIEVEIPRIPNELTANIHFVKLPNFLSLDTHPYDPSWYEDEIDEDEVLDDEGRARLKLKVESTIRWRNVPDENGELLKESNARVVKWSDGSLSLHLGSEIFDIQKQPLQVGDNNHLFVRQGTGLQGRAVFKSKLSFRPHSTDSFTHRKMTLSLAERSHKTQKIRVLPNVGADPEANRHEMLKKEEDKLRASIRRESKARRQRERTLARGPNASYFEGDDDDEGGVSLAAIKNSYKRGGVSRGRYSEIYSDSDDASVASEKNKDEDDSDDSDLEFNRKKERKTVTIDDDDDE